MAPVMRTNVDFRIENRPADGIKLPILGSGDLGTSPLLGSSQSSNLLNHASTYHSCGVAPNEFASSHLLQRHFELPVIGEVSQRPFLQRDLSRLGRTGDGFDHRPAM
jgi:hypothetical protein